MSNLIVNIRFGCWHFQVRRGPPWVEWSYNSVHIGNPNRFAIYQLFGWRP